MQINNLKGEIPLQALYTLYLTDIMGTTTPKSHIQEIADFILNSKDTQKKICEKLGKQADIEGIIKKGLARANAGEKDHPEFKEYIKTSDMGSEIGYKSGSLKMPIFEDARAALQIIYEANGRIRVFSSGGIGGMKAGMQTAGLDEIIECYHSSSQPEIGSKYSANAYKEIAKTAGVSLRDMVYITDDAKEADAAVSAGVGQVYLVDPKAAETGKKNGYNVVKSYKDVAAATTRKNAAKAGPSKGAAQASG